ncbi:substrate-binding domain-containing protein [Streptomyces sp. NPDC048481]|uniref:phosphorylase family protein n=1 Tax=Streptomyces sp. NPDC048481 TaxID=3365557 RepID=UPI003720CB0E
MTALPVEFSPLRDRLGAAGARHTGQLRAGSTVVQTFALDGAYASWTVHLAQVGMTNVVAALGTHGLLEVLRPDVALLVGIAGSLKEDVPPGDVVVATKVYEIHGAKVTAAGRGARPDAVETSHALRQTALYARVGAACHYKPIASGDVVLDAGDGDIRSRLESTYQDAVALEMEGFGFCMAAQRHRTEALVVRGISDRADGGKGAADAGGGQQTAAARAAEVAVAVLLEHQPESVRRTGGGGDDGHGGDHGTTAGSGAGGGTGSGAGGSGSTGGDSGTSGGSGAGGGGKGTVGTGGGGGWKRPWLRLRTPGSGTRSSRFKGRAKLAWLPVAAAAVTLGIVLQSCGNGAAGSDDGRQSSASVVPALASCERADAAPVLVAASADKSEPMRRAARAYGNRAAGGSCLTVKVEERNSGEAMRALVDGWSESDGTEPDVWAPAGNTWLSLARAGAKGANAKRFPARAQSIVQSPLTVAMPKPMADALNWPEARFTWGQLAQWAQHADGFWAARGKPEWGSFKLGKTNPKYSTSGLNATVGAFYAKTGTSGELGVPHIDNAENQKFVKSIEQAAVHYGDTTLTFLANLREADRSSPQKAMSYISAVTVEESSVAAYNAGYPCGALSADKDCARTAPPDTPLVSFYPKDGVPFSDHPYIELNGMDSAHKAVADDFLRYLQSPAVFDAQFAPYGFRTHTGAIPAKSALLTEANGIPEAEFTHMPMPRGDVLARLLRLWPDLRRPANVCILIDTSESMNRVIPGTGDSKLARLQQAGPRLFGEFTAADRVGLWKFSDAFTLGGRNDYKELVPLGPYRARMAGSTRAELLAENVGNLTAEGATGLNDTLDAALKAMRAHYDPRAINAIVLLTDGFNEDGDSLSDAALEREIKDPSQQRIRVFTIAYGSEADPKDQQGSSALKEIAKAGGGKYYDAKRAETIDQVITSVISNF